LKNLGVFLDGPEILGSATEQLFVLRVVFEPDVRQVAQQGMHSVRR
jgi:hypothetical protein